MAYEWRKVRYVHTWHASGQKLDTSTRGTRVEKSKILKHVPNALIQRKGNIGTYPGVPTNKKKERGGHRDISRCFGEGTCKTMQVRGVQDNAHEICNNARD